jgi:hypothetical protein
MVIGNLGIAMDNKVIGVALVLAAIFWAWRMIKSWWFNRAVNKISEEEKAIIKEKLKHESKIEEVSSQLESVKTDQDGKTDKQIEDFWNSRK